ncbi:ANTAR domain-containing response regulator [Asaia lannensis]|uniref:ANTAR domain-containing protein n=1 Tax=Asaia lannensis NBRC 102526 TaxID=1307926 RepID=A0ABT1CIA7_9PROT|nr:ANTAR domain-containing protein [Asaia lannensis]MCO6160594.1 ANTAR domain-containing protein [Asaia lannensis NBRC 102526]GBQ95364.1 two component response regulator [Asaia lannensis NBRC 102526]
MRVLIADSNSHRAVALSELLAADTDLEVICPASGMPLIEAVSLGKPDIVLVDLGTADRDALDSVRVLAGAAQSRPVALFVDRDDEALMQEAFDAGVCSYNVIGALPHDVKPVLRAAIALYARFQQQAAALNEAQRHLAEREVIDRAKRLFIMHEKAGEAAAHRWFQKRAMQEGRRMVDVCQQYLDVNLSGAKP